ncbi:contractile injection system tape measure protein [Oxalobacteraceae bacterium OTU3REALA1]|nr:contractile injection system tape measure protein [Oxalobacteraceae bacterium OTU3REALA1]
MRPLLPHTIQSQTFEVEVSGSESDAMALQRRLAALSASLMPVIEQALDRYAPEHGILRIDRLEVDAGRVALARLEGELPALLRRGLEEALSARIHSAQDGADAASHVGVTQAMDEALSYFLRYATLPASLHLAPSQDFEQMLLEVWRGVGVPPADARLSASFASAAAGLPSLSPSLTATLRSGGALDRLGRQFSSTFQQVMVARLTPMLAQTLQSALQYLRAQEQGAMLAAAERLLCRAALELALDERTTIDALPVQEALWRGFPERAGRAALSVARQAGAEKRPVPVLLKNGAAAAEARRVPDVPAPPVARDAVEHPDSAHGIYIDNAGLVLLHPFLPALFEELGLARDGQLMRPERALALLHFLASGQPQAPEYALALPKLLCQLPLTANIEPGVVLHAAEQAEADVLLKAVIGHWSALRDTSPDGLRGAFLLRPGKLSERGGEWLLQVERQTADILLGDLPWGYSAIRLPWMAGILWVEWN